MTRPGHIGLVTPGWPGFDTPNGIATAVYYLARGLQDTGLQPVIITRKIDGALPPDIPVVQIPDLSWRWQDRLRQKLGDRHMPQWQIGREIAAGVQQAATQHGLDAVIMEESNGWAHVVQRQTRLPVIVALHGPWAILGPLVSRQGAKADRQREHREILAYRGAAGLVAPSRNVLETVQALAPLSQTPSLVVPHALAAPADPGPVAAADHGQDILFVGRFDELKGGDVVLAAFAQLCDRNPEARLTFVGNDHGVLQKDGRVVRMDEALAALPAPVRDRVTYLGKQPRAAVAALRKTHAIALIASHYETFGYTLLEAMAAGQAIVCTNVGGPAEVLRDGETGLLVPPGDPAAMATALGRVLTDAGLAQRLGQAGRDAWQAGYTPAAVAGPMAGFIARVLSRQGLPH